LRCITIFGIFLKGLFKVSSRLKVVRLVIISDAKFVADAFGSGVACCQCLKLDNGFLVFVFFDKGAGRGQCQVLLLGDQVRHE